MAEAVFSLSAEITPVVNDRELERQAQALARQLNGILAKNIDTVDPKIQSGAFKPFQKEAERAADTLKNKLSRGFEEVKNGANNFAKSARSGLLKVTDALKLTRTGLLGFTGSIKDSIQQNSLFEKSLEGLKGLGGVFEDIGAGSFSELASRFEVGATSLQDLAARGSEAAKALLPLTEASIENVKQVAEQTNITEVLSRTLASLPANIAKAIAGTDELEDSLDRLANTSDLLETPASNIGKRMDALRESMGGALDVLKKTGDEFRKGLVDAADIGDVDSFLKVITATRDEAAKSTGIVGRLKQAVGLLSEEERKAAIALEQELNAELVSLAKDGIGPGVTGLKRLEVAIVNGAAKFVEMQTAVQRVTGNLGNLANEFNKVGTIGSTAIGQKVLTAIDNVTKKIGTSNFVQGMADNLIKFANTAEATFATIGQAAQDFGIGLAKRFDTAFLGVREKFQPIVGGAQLAMGAALSVIDNGLATMVQSVSQGAGQLFGLFKNARFGEDIAAAFGSIGPSIKRALSGAADATVSFGRSIVDGLRKGIESSGGGLGGTIKFLKDTVLNGLKKAFGIASPAESTKPIGNFLVQGIVAGINAAKGLITNALTAVTSGFSALASSALEFGRAAATVAGVALGGIAANAIHAGIEFNKLQQVIRGTLPVLVGSKEAANDLLAEINALNDSSPFARSAFLELTRVLAGFGVEATKIPGLIDAIQQTVAATGGGEQDLLELGNAFARVQSQGRLTGDVLQSFTSRGVDAIGILASVINKDLPDGLKKTTTDIREMISNGLIPADLAITALTEGLKEKFDGATEAVSKNLPGALDRIRAKLRDAGAAVTSAFVNPEGGGALVEFLNSLSNTIGTLTRTVLPLLAPLLQSAADQLVRFGEFIESVGQRVANSTNSIKEFVSGLQPALPIFAALLGFAPGLLSFLPVIGPLLGSIGGPFLALSAAVGVFAIQSEEFRAVLSDLGETVLNVFGFITENFAGVAAAFGTFLAFIPNIVTGAGAFSKILAPIAQLLTKLPVLGGLFASSGASFGLLAGPIGLIATLFVTMVAKSEGFRNALAQLFKAIQPLIGIIGGVFADAIEILNAAFDALEPAFIVIVNNLQLFARFLTPGAQIIGQLVKALKNLLVPILKQVGSLINTTANFFTDFINFVIKGINLLIKAYNKLPGFLRGDKIKPIEPIVLEVKEKGIDAVTAKVKTLEQVSIDAGIAITDALGKAEFAANAAATRLGSAIDTVRTSLESAEKAITPVLDAGRAARDAQKAVADAQAAQSQSTKNLTQIENDRARALKDVISPINEVAAAERGLAKIRRDLEALGREQVEIERELRELRGEEAADDRAALDRAILRAKISLNQARQAEIDLLKEGNKEERTGVNLAGLSLEQVKSRLANVRLSLSAQKQSQSESTKEAKTQQQIDDERLSAKLDVVDAEQALKDANKARVEFERTNSEAIRSNEERLLVLREDKAEKLLEEQTALTEIERLRQGETTQQKLILDFDEKIKAAKEQQEAAAKKVADAIKNAATANAELAKQQAIITGNVEAQALAQQTILNLKRDGVQFDKATEAAIAGQLANVQAVIAELAKVRADADVAQKELAKNQAAAAFAEALRTQSTASSGLAAGGFFTDPKTGALLYGEALAKFLNDQQTDIAENLTNTFNQLRATGGTTDPTTIAAVAAAVDAALKNFGAAESLAPELRAIIGRILRELKLTVPQGFAGGYAPGEGEVHQGMNNGRGLVRMFEYGKEAVLPLTRAMDMARVVRNPSVLPAILNALPRWTMPQSSPNTATASLASMPKASSSVGSNRVGDNDARRQRHEMANAIGLAVKSAVKEAIAESGGMEDRPVNINVASPTGNEKIIAREVKRQVEKHLRGF